MQNFSAVSVEEHMSGGTLWVAVRARGAEWSWLTPADAVALAGHWMKTYGGKAADSGEAAHRQQVVPKSSLSAAAAAVHPACG